MRKSLRQVKYVNTNTPEECVILLKPRHVSETLDDEYEIVGARPLIQWHIERPTILGNICLAEIASFYAENETTKPSRSKKIAQKSHDGCLPETSSTDDQDPPER